MYVANLIFYKINNFYSLDTTVSPVIVCVIQGLFVCVFVFFDMKDKLTFNWQLLSLMIKLGEAELEIFSSSLVQVSSNLQRYPLACTTTKII